LLTKAIRVRIPHCELKWKMPVYNLRNAWAAVSKAAEGNPTNVGLTPDNVAVPWVCRDYPVRLTPAEISRLVFRAKIVRG